MTKLLIACLVALGAATPGLAQDRPPERLPLNPAIAQEFQWIRDCHTHQGYYSLHITETATGLHAEYSCPDVPGMATIHKFYVQSIKVDHGLTSSGPARGTQRALLDFLSQEMSHQTPPEGSDFAVMRRGN